MPAAAPEKKREIVENFTPLSEAPSSVRDQLVNRPESIAFIIKEHNLDPNEVNEFIENHNQEMALGEIPEEKENEETEEEHQEKHTSHYEPHQHGPEIEHQIEINKQAKAIEEATGEKLNRKGTAELPTTTKGWRKDLNKRIDAQREQFRQAGIDIPDTPRMSSNPEKAQKQFEQMQDELRQKINAPQEIQGDLSSEQMASLSRLKTQKAGLIEENKNQPTSVEEQTTWEKLRQKKATEIRQNKGEQPAFPPPPSNTFRPPQQQQGNVAMNLFRDTFNYGKDKAVNWVQDKVIDKFSDFFARRAGEQAGQTVVENAGQTILENTGQSFLEGGTETVLEGGGEALTEAGLEGAGELATTGLEVGGEVALEGGEIAVEGGIAAAGAVETLGISIAIAAATHKIIKFIKKHHLIKKLKENPEVLLLGAPGWIIILIVVGLLILLVALFMQLSQNSQQYNQSQSNQTAIPCLTMTVTGPDHVPDPPTNPPPNTPPPDIKYVVDISYCGYDAIQLVNPIPANLGFISASGNPDKSSGSPTWELDALQPTSTDADGTRHYQLNLDFSLLQTAKDQVITETINAYDETLNSQGQPVPGLTLTMTSSPNPAKVTDTITYTITATYTGNDNTLMIFDKIPANTTLVGTPTGNYKNSNGLLSWKWTDNKPASGNTLTLSFQVKPTQDNITLANTVYATAQGGLGKDVIWLTSGTSQEFSDGSGGTVCDGCRDPVTGITSYWISGQCSQASLTEVLNAYNQRTVIAPNTGTYYKTIEVERISYKLGVWDGAFLWKPTQKASWDIEAKYFHLNDNYSTMAATDQNLGQLIQTANAGTPIITNAPNHWLVIWGGDSQYVYLLDSSPHNLTWAQEWTNDSVTIHKQNYPAVKVLRSTFLRGAAGFNYYWGADPTGNNPTPQVVILTPQ